MATPVARKGEGVRKVQTTGSKVLRVSGDAQALDRATVTNRGNARVKRGNPPCCNLRNSVGSYPRH